MLRQAQHERKSHMISTYPVRPEPVEGQTVGLSNSPFIYGGEKQR